MNACNDIVPLTQFNSCIDELDLFDYDEIECSDLDFTLDCLMM